MVMLVDRLKDQIIQQFSQGASIVNIASEFHVARNTVGRRLRLWGYDTSVNFKGDLNNQLKDRTDEVIELYNNGLTIAEIARKLNYAESSISRLLDNNDINKRDDRYQVNQDFFKIIDTPNKAYILGWWYSDGNINFNYIRLYIASEDDYILDWIKEQLNFSGELKRYPSREPHHKPMTTLSICKRSMAQDMIGLGCCVAKSMILKFPTYNQVPLRFIPDFIRGYFDGDGSVGNGISFVGTLAFITRLVDFLPLEITNIYQHFKDRAPEDSSHKLLIGRKSEMLKFYDFIYYDSSLMCLRRKRDKLRKLLNIAA